MEIENILKLIQAVSESELTQFHYQDGEVSLKLGKKDKEVVVKEASLAGAMQPVQQPVQQVSASPVVLAEAVQQAVEETAVVQKTDVVEGEEVKSPLVGTFYSAPSPDEPPFVKVGDQVKKGQTLGIVEAMKLMNEIESECDGVVKAVLVENEEIVEYGQPLFVIG